MKGVGSNKFTVKKSYKHYLSWVIKVNIGGDKLHWWYDDVRKMIAYFCDHLPKMHCSSLIMRKTAAKYRQRNVSQNTVFLTMIKAHNK